MEILRINVGGFRNISNVEVSFDNPITAFVGLNGYGKSNFFDAIDFGFDFIHQPNNVHPAMMAFKNNIPILKANAGMNYSFEVEVKLISNKKEFFVLYGFEFKWNTSQSTSGIVKEYLKIKENQERQKYKVYFTRDNNRARYIPSATGRCDKKIIIDETSLVLIKLTALDDLFYLDIVKQIAEIQYYIERHLDAAPSYDPDLFMFKGFKELEINSIQSIPRAIFYLKQEYHDKYLLLENAFTHLFPDVQQISVNEHKVNNLPEVNIPEDVPIMFTENVYSLSIVDKRMIQPIPFERLSDGTKRLFLMLTFAIIADIKNLSMIAIEEPENSIHPGLFQSYLDVLSQITNNCKIIITSHSPYIIQYIDPRSIYIGLPSETGETDFIRIASTKINALYKDAREYDRSIGDYIFSIMSDSEPYEYLKDYLETNGR